MALFYYPAFDAVIIDENGFRHPLPSTTFDVDNLTDPGSLGTVSSDAFGVVAAGSFDDGFFGVAEGDVIEISHGTYPGKLRFVLQATAAAAFESALNDGATLVAENNFTDTIEPELIGIYLQDKDEPGTPPVAVATGKQGETVRIPYQTAIDKEVRLYLVPISTKFQFSAGDFRESPFDDLNIPALSPGISIGGPVIGGGPNRVLYANASEEIETSARLQFDGTDLALIDTTAATVGSPQVRSPYLYLRGRRWNGADSQSDVRIYQLPRAYGANDYRPGFAVDFNNGSGWVQAFAYGATDTGNLSTIMKLRHPDVEAWGGNLEVTYDSVFSFKTPANALAGLNPAYISWVGSSSYQNIQTADSGYSTTLNLFFGGTFRIKPNFSGEPSLRLEFDGSNYLKSSTGSDGATVFDAVGSSPSYQFRENGNAFIYMPGTRRLGVGVSPTAKLQVRSTTEQLRLDHSDGNYLSVTVGSNGTVTFDSVGSKTGFLFQDEVEIADGKAIKAGDTAGLTIGTAATEKLGFFGATPVTQRTNIGALTDSTGGSVGSIIDDPTGGSDTVDVGIVNDNFASLADRINKIEQVLQDLGLTA